MTPIYVYLFLCFLDLPLKSSVFREPICYDNFDVLPHRDAGCRSIWLPHPVTVCKLRASESLLWGRYHGDRRPSSDEFSQSSRHSTIGTRQTEYHEALPSSANVQSHLISSFADDGNASWCSVCRVPMAEWRLDCENCRHLTVVGLHNTCPWPMQACRSVSTRLPMLRSLVWQGRKRTSDRPYLMRTTLPLGNPDSRDRDQHPTVMSVTMSISEARPQGFSPGTPVSSPLSSVDGSANNIKT